MYMTGLAAENDAKTAEKLQKYKESLSKEEIEKKLQLLQQACKTGDDDHMKEVLRIVVPTYKRPEAVNRTAGESMEMKMAIE